MKMNNYDNNLDEIDLIFLFKELLNKKYLIIFTTLFFAISSVIYSLSLPNIYRSEAILMPSISDSSSPLASSGIGALAGIVGVNIGSGSNSTVSEAIQRMSSLSFFSRLSNIGINSEDLLAIKSWDPINNFITYDESVFNQETGDWIRDLEITENPAPSLQEQFSAFDSIFDVSLIEGEFINISIEHQSPYIAKNWLDLVISEINLLMRIDDEEYASNAIEYLNNQIATTNLIEVRQALAELIQDQVQTLSLTNVSDEYIFKVIDPPYVPEVKVSPNRSLICILGTIIGFLLSIFLALIKSRFEN